MFVLCIYYSYIVCVLWYDVEMTNDEGKNVTVRGSKVVTRVLGNNDRFRYLLFLDSGVVKFLNLLLLTFIIVFLLTFFFPSFPFDFYFIFFIYIPITDVSNHLEKDFFFLCCHIIFLYCKRLNLTLLCHCQYNHNILNLRMYSTKAFVWL